MKKLFKITSLAVLFGLSLWSCDEDEHSPRLTNISQNEAVINVLTPTASTISDITITEPVLENTWQTFKFESNMVLEDVFAPQTISYEVLLDEATDNFASPVVLKQGSSSPLSVTYKELNDKLVEMGYDVLGESNTFVIKVIARVGGGSYTLSSNTIDTFKVTALGIVTIPQLYAVGAHNSWDAGAAIQMRQVKINGVFSYYEIYINATGDRNFKFLKTLGDWGSALAGGSDINVSDEPTSFQEFTFSGSDGAYKMPVDGLYYIRVNKEMTKMNVIQMKWGIIGNGTPSGWGGETAFTYNSDTKTFVYTGELFAGEMKFRCKNAGDAVFSGEWKYNVGNEKSPVYKDAEGLGGDSNFITTAQNPSNITFKVNYDGSVNVTGI